MAELSSGKVETLLAKAQALVDAITFDENGAMVAGEWRGGNGGMVSRPTIVAADTLRTELLVWKGDQVANMATRSPPLVGPADE